MPPKNRSRKRLTSPHRVAYGSYPTDHDGYAYPPMGGEERELRYLNRLKALAARADAEGRAKEFAQALRRRRAAGVPVSRPIADDIKDYERARVNLWTLTSAVCAVYTNRLFDQVFAIPRNSKDWYDIILYVLRCLYRNVKMFQSGEFMKVMRAITEKCEDLWLDASELFERYFPIFEKLWDDDLATKARVKQHLSTLLDEFINLSYGSDYGIAKKMSQVALQIDMEETEALAKCLIAKPKPRLNIKLRKHNKTTITVVKEDQSSAKCPLSECPQLYDDGAWASDIDADIEGPKFTTVMAGELQNKLLGICDYLDDDLRCEFDSVIVAVNREFVEVTKLSTEELVDIRDLMMDVAQAIMRYIRENLEVEWENPHHKMKVISLVCKALDKLFKEVIHRRIEKMSPMALFGTNESFPYVLKRQLLKDFQEEVPYLREAPWGPLPVRGSGFLEIVDDKGNVLKTQAYYSPQNRRLVEDVRKKRAMSFRVLMTQKMPAVLPHQVIFDAGYNYHSGTRDCQRYCNLQGGSIWRIATRKNRLCVPLVQLPQMTKLIESLAEIELTPFEKYIIDNNKYI